MGENKTPQIRALHMHIFCFRTELPQDMSTLRKEFPEGFMFGARAIDFDYIKGNKNTTIRYFRANL